MTKASLPVIVTRAEPGASETAIWLEAEGYRPILSPAIILQAIDPVPTLSLDGLQGLVFTSANGVRFFSELEERREFTAWCVGPATAEAARIAGFSDVRAGTGDAIHLAERITETASADGRAFLHAGNVAAGEVFVKRLQLAGFAARFAALYESLPAKELTSKAQSLMSTAEKCAVLVHSAKGAEAFAELSAGYDFTNAILVAISDQAAAPVGNSGFGRTVLANHPFMGAMSQALKSARATL